MNDKSSLDGDVTRSTSVPPRRSDFLAGGGELGQLMRAHDWAATSLGPPESWPRPLRTAVRLMLNTGHPMYRGGSGNLHRGDKWIADLTAAMLAARRRQDEQETAPEPQPGVQG